MYINLKKADNGHNINIVVLAETFFFFFGGATISIRCSSFNLKHSLNSYHFPDTQGTKMKK